MRTLRSIAKNEIDCEKERQNNRHLAKEATDKIQAYNKVYYDHKHHKSTTYKPGDYIMVRDMVVKSGENKKLKQAYKVLYMIMKVK